MKTGTALSAGLKALPDKASSFASTQAAWRFYANESVTLPVLQEPLTEAAHVGVRQWCDGYALCIHDWSRLAYRHANKPDTYVMTHQHDVGYDLQSSLLVSDRDGQPLAPVALRLVSQDGSYSTYAADAADITPVREHLDEVTHSIHTLERQGFDKPLVHLIDREADSVGHLRQWEHGGYRWLIRVKAHSRLAYQGQTTNSKTLAETLAFERTRKVTHKGGTYWQWVAETSVSLTRPAKPSRKKSPKPAVPGSPVEARLIISRILAQDGRVLAEWYLLTNVPAVDQATLALWYYWRWRMESFFKLMKSAGHQLESWQQESALAIAKRLLVACMACVTVWAIAADNTQEAAELRTWLIKLSGRQMKRKQSFTYPALLDGMWALLAMLEIMETYSPEQLDDIKKTVRRFV